MASELAEDRPPPETLLDTIPPAFENSDSDAPVAFTDQMFPELSIAMPNWPPVPGVELNALPAASRELTLPLLLTAHTCSMRMEIVWVADPVV
jgi:hypothetical protein